MNFQPKTEPGSPPLVDSNGHGNMSETMSISEIVSAMHAGVDRFQEVLLAKHKAEIGPLQEKFELERLMRIQADEELKRARDNYEALLKKVKESEFCNGNSTEVLRNKSPHLKRKRVDDNDSNNVVAELRIRVTELESENLKLKDVNKKNLEIIEKMRIEITELGRKKINANAGAEPLENAEKNNSVGVNTEWESQTPLQRNLGQNVIFGVKPLENAEKNNSVGENTEWESQTPLQRNFGHNAIFGVKPLENAEKNNSVGDNTGWESQVPLQRNIDTRHTLGASGEKMVKSKKSDTTMDPSQHIMTAIQDIDHNIFEEGTQDNPSTLLFDINEVDPSSNQVYQDEEDNDRDSELLEDNVEEEGDMEECTKVANNSQASSLVPFMRTQFNDSLFAPEFSQFECKFNYHAGSGELCVGMTFDTLDQVKQSVKSFSIKNCVDFKVLESQPRAYYCKCKSFEQGCEWLLRASYRKRKKVWEIIKYKGPHTCVTSMTNTDHSKMDAVIIADEIEQEVKVNPSIKIKVIQSKMKSKYGFSPSYYKAWAGKQKAIARGNENWEDSYADLAPWLTALSHIDPKTCADFQTVPAYNNSIVQPNVRIFCRLFWTFGPMIRAFEHCKSLVEVGGIHLYGQFKHKFLVACSQDGNNNILPLAFAIVEEETPEAWYYFLNKLRIHVVGMREICLISYRHQSIISAMERLGSQWAASHFFCVRHIGANFRREFRTKYLEHLVINMGYSVNQTEFNCWYKKLRTHGEQYTTWIDAIPRHQWVCCFDNGRRYGHMTSNLVESVNAIFKDVRSLPVTVLVESTYFRMNELFVKRRIEAYARKVAGHKFSEVLSKKLEDIQQSSGALRVSMFSSYHAQFHVRDSTTEIIYFVDLKLRECDCGEMQTMRYPCCHAMAACHMAHLNWHAYVDHVYVNAKVCKVYQPKFKELPTKDKWSTYEGPIIVPHPNMRRTDEVRHKSTHL